MTTQRANVFSLLFIAVASALAAYLYPDLPQQIPAHWNIDGDIDGYLSKPWGVLVLPAGALLVFAIMRLIPVISPRGYRTDKFMDVINVFTVVFVGFMCGIAVMVLLAANGQDVRINEIMFASVGLLFVVLGNYLGKVRKNFFIGIRTPWTLASDEVWSRTHRFGSRVFILLGLFLMVNSITRIPVQWLIWSSIAAALLPVVYSYVIYRNIEGFPAGEDDDAAD